MTSAIAGNRSESGCRLARFEAAQATASRNGLSSYAAWRASLERRYTVMPTWYWDESVCRQNYAAHVQDVMAWQAKQARINRTGMGLHETIKPGG